MSEAAPDALGMVAARRIRGPANDSATFLEKKDGFATPGPIRTNVNDCRIALVD